MADKQAVTKAIAELTADAGPCDILVTAAGQARPWGRAYAICIDG